MAASSRAAVACCIVVSLVSTARAQPRLPLPLREVLRHVAPRVGVAPEIVESLTSDAPPDAPQTMAHTKPHLAALMERAREGDVALDPDATVFDDATVRLGLWDSPRFLNRYGTAVFPLEPWDGRRVPVILVHGIKGSPRNFARLAARFRSSRYLPVAFFYPTGMPLGDAGRELGARLEELFERHPTAGFAVVGHSMGGLVAKAMLDGLDGALPALRVLVGVSSPWGGVAAASHSGRLRSHPASWDDLAPGSAFVRRINATPVPDGVALYLFFGARGRSVGLSGFGSNDGRLSLASMMDAPLVAQARDTFGFYEDHVSILTSARVLDRLERVLDDELRPPSGGRRRVAGARIPG